MDGKHCVLACVTVQKDCARLIRRGQELAREAGIPLRVLHVCLGKNMLSSPDTAAILDELFSLAHEADAEMSVLYEIDVPAAIAGYAAEYGADTLVLGPDRSGTASRVRALLPAEIKIVREE
ncbi:MAG: universal stress protein [Clostridia bacterium]|nr:universal stress protein [Clostridia bacterium]MBR4331513.1 universal stress protein [Clostridia bacterium]MBR4359307.1 universal stress protein [Clostridia bacterium]